MPSRTDRTCWSFACSSARFDRIALGWATGPPVYVRLGSTNREADPQLINQLQREAEGVSFDESPLVHMPATDVDLAAVMRFIRRRTRNAITIDGLTRTEHPEYPLQAVREALVNAVAHADYSQLGAPIRVCIFADRLEIESPGVMPYSIDHPAGPDQHPDNSSPSGFDLWRLTWRQTPRTVTDWTALPGLRRVEQSIWSPSAGAAEPAGAAREGHMN